MGPRNGIAQALASVLQFFRFTDENGFISLTNIAVIVIIVKIALAQNQSYADMGALLAVLGNYAFKRQVNATVGAT